MTTEPVQHTTFLRRAAPSLVSAPVAAAGFVVLHRLDLIADIGIWQLLTVLALGAAAGIVAYEMWPDDATDVQVFARTAVTMMAVTAVTYATGWGPAMGIGYGFQGSLEIRRSGARAGRPAAFWAVLAIIAGQIAIATGVAPSQIAEPQVHGISALIALGAVLMIVMLGEAEREREAIERRVRESEERFRSLVENAADAVVLADGTGTVVYASPAAQHEFGFDLAALTGQAGFDLVHPDSLATASEYFQRVLSTPGSHAPVELLCRMGDGSWRWLEIRCSNRLDDPSVRGIVANVTDVHDRKKAVEDLREQTARFETLIGVVSDLGIGFVIADAGGIQYANDAMCRIGGRTLEDLYAMGSFVDLVAPDQREEARARITARMSGEPAPDRFEISGLHADGSVIDLEVSAKVLTVGGGTQVAAVVTDITPRKRAAKVMRDETQRSEALLGALADLGVGFAIADEASIRYVNDAWTRITGYTSAELLALSGFAEIVVPEQSAMIAERLRRRIAGEYAPEHYEITFVHKSGRHVDVEVAAKLIEIDGKPQIVSVVTDITERKHAEKALRQFIANAAHELRTPLTTLVGVASTLASHQHAMSEEEFRQSLLALKRQGQRTGILIQSLLDLSKIESGNLEVELSDVTLADVADRALEAYPPPEGRRVDVRIERDLMVRAEAARLEQVLVNLLTNAYRYGGHAIAVEAARNGQRVIASVTDDGPGVPAELVPHLFDPFSRGPGTQGLVGSGLGLAICRALMEAFRGSIAYEQGSDGGTRFVLSLVPAEKG